jgi:excisionase family DNA binding protein
MARTFPEVMTINETSEYLRIPLSTVYKLAQDGRIPSQKVGRHWRFHRRAIDQWLGEISNHNKASNPDGNPS